MQQEMSFQLVGGSFNVFFLLADFLYFWFVSAPLGLIRYLNSLNRAFLKLLSYKVLATTFFQPWKNEYREGLVGFSLVMGMAFKSGILLFETVIFFLLLILEILFVCAFLVWPFVTIWLVFI